jgi:hypothetical protein
MIGGLAMVGRNGDEAGAGCGGSSSIPRITGEVREGDARSCAEMGAGASLSEGFFWTVDDLPESRHLYDKVGFRVTEQHPARITRSCSIT